MSGVDGRDKYGMMGKLPFAHRRRVAVFGGSFDPLHTGHVNMAKYLLGMRVMLNSEDSVRSGNISIAEYMRRSLQVMDIYKKRCEKFSRLKKEYDSGRGRTIDTDMPLRQPEPPLRPVECGAIEEVLFVPALCSPLKEGTGSSPADRLEMLRRVCIANEGFSYSDIELRRNGKSYSFDTMNTLSKVYKDFELYFTMGMDSLATLGRWYRAQEFVQRFNFIIYPRPGVAVPSFVTLEKEFGTRNANKLLNSILPQEVFSSGQTATDVASLVAQGDDLTGMLPPEVAGFIVEKTRTVLKCIKAPVFDQSSTEVREMVARGEGLSEVLPPEVAEYIGEKRLYRN